MQRQKGERATILVVDDYADTRHVVRWMLEREGYRVVEAANGEEAIEVALRERPHAVLMDLTMPVVDGIEAIGRLRTTGELKNMRIIAVTAYDMAESRARAELAGCDFYLSKPIDFIRLSVLLEKFLRESSSENAAA